jgi:hypothetical protein
MNLSCHIKKQVNRRSTLEQLTLGNYVRRLACLVAYKLSFSAFRELHCNCFAVSSICAAPFNYICWTQYHNNSRKLRLHCRHQFPWCALALKFRRTQLCGVSSAYKRSTITDACPKPYSRCSHYLSKFVQEKIHLLNFGLCCTSCVKVRIRSTTFDNAPLIALKMDLC